MTLHTKLLAALLAAASVGTAQAADGCKFLLCIAGPWQSISECNSFVREVLRDTAMGRPFPTCDFADSGNGTSSENEYIVQGTCPDMYKVFNDVNDRYLRCTYRWRIPVYIDGYGLWEIVYWDTFGSSTWYSDAAREGLDGQPLDPRYDEDQAAWDKAHQPPPDEPPGGS